MLLDTSKHNSYLVALMVGHTLTEIANLDGVTYDELKNNVIDLGLGEDIDLDSVDASFSNDLQNLSDIYDVAIIAYLDSVGVPEDVISDMMSHKDTYSLDAISTIAKSYKENFDTDQAILDSAENFAMNFAKTEITFDAVPAPKAGYKRKLVVRAGKKQWVNKRVSGRTRLSPKQKLALTKARMKAHSGLAKQHRAKSMRTRRNSSM